MQKYYLDYSLNAAREMVNAYYVDKNVDGVFKHIYKGNFSWMGYDYDLFFNDADEFRKFAESKLEFLSDYKLIEEDYSVVSETQESCIIIAKIKLIDTSTQKIFDMNMFFLLLPNRSNCNLPTLSCCSSAARKDRKQIDTFQ